MEGEEGEQEQRESAVWDLPVLGLTENQSD